MADKYLLVCEGASDIALIKAVADRLSIAKKRNIEIKELSPSRDATTLRYPDHGWKEVRNWCRQYGDGAPVSTHANPAMALAFAKANLRKNWSALLKMSQAKGLIIQLDTDIAHDIKVNNISGTPGDRNHCHQAISEWLGFANVPDTVHYLLPSFSTESWILALHDEDHQMFTAIPKPISYESIQDPCNVLIQGGYRSYFHEQKGVQCLSKDYGLFTNYGNAIGDNYKIVADRCPEFSSFIDYI